MSGWSARRLVELSLVALSLKLSPFAGSLVASGRDRSLPPTLAVHPSSQASSNATRRAGGPRGDSLEERDHGRRVVGRRGVRRRRPGNAHLRGFVALGPALQEAVWPVKTNRVSSSLVIRHRQRGRVGAGGGVGAGRGGAAVCKLASVSEVPVVAGDGAVGINMDAEPSNALAEPAVGEGTAKAAFGPGRGDRDPEGLVPVPRSPSPRSRSWWCRSPTLLSLA